MTYREAVRAALRKALRSDPRVFLMGEDVGRYGGAFAVSLGLLAEFGPERIRAAVPYMAYGLPAHVHPSQLAPAASPAGASVGGQGRR